MRVKNNKATQGFSLVEMLVVLAIMALLVGLVGPKLMEKLDNSEVQTATAQLKMLKGTLEALRLDIGRFPTEAEGLAMLNIRPNDEKLKTRWRGPYLDGDLPKDPWGGSYQYSIPGANGQPFALYSLGKDGKRGGEELNADIGYLPPN